MRSFFVASIMVFTPMALTLAGIVQAAAQAVAVPDVPD